MKSKHKKRGILLVVVLIVVLVFAYRVRKIIAATKEDCSAHAEIVTLEQSSQNGNAPLFIDGYWPTETEKRTLPCYVLTTDMLALRRGIGVILDTNEIAKYEISNQANSVEESFTDRVYLYVDGKSVSNSSRMIIDNMAEIFVFQYGIKYPTGMSSEYQISWTPLILSGKHVSKIIIHTKSGKVFEFEWRFTLFD